MNSFRKNYEKLQILFQCILKYQKLQTKLPDLVEQWQGQKNEGWQALSSNPVNGSKNKSFGFQWPGVRQLSLKQQTTNPLARTYNYDSCNMCPRHQLEP